MLKEYREILKSDINEIIYNFKIDNGIDKLKENIEESINTLIDEIEADAKEALEYMDELSSLGEAKDKLTEIVKLLY